MKNMAQFVMFIYSLIIFLFLFLGEAAFKRTESTMCMHFYTIFYVF